LSYDRNNNDLYIHDDILCLNYSETLQSFISFYDYIDVSQMKNVWDEFISINTSTDVDGKVTSNIWLTNKGDYNSFYGTQKPFSVEYLINPEPINDKVFNTFEYRLNDQTIDWNSVVVSNWYQIGELNSNQFKANMKRKFNVNRVQLPRQNNSLNRIRSTWMKLKVAHELTTINSNNKFDMQDLNITYTI